MSGTATHATAAVAVPATTANLGPGFDAFGAALSLRLTVRAVPAADAPDAPLVTTKGTGVDGDGADAPPTGEDNLVHRSLVAACDRFGWDVPDVRLQVHTPIPFSRGLGSSSAAIVGGLGIARVLAGADAAVSGADDASVGDTALVRFATELEGHPDNVAPAVHGGLVACVQTDDGRLVVRTSPPPPTTRPVLLVPSTPSSTVETRGAVPDALSRDDVVVQAARAGHVLAGLTGAWPVEPMAAGDRLHEHARTSAQPTSARLLAAARAAGLHAWLSGAGSSVAVALGRHEDVAVVDRLVEGTDAAVLELDWDRQGIRSCVAGGCGVAGGPGCGDCPLTALQ